MEMSQEFTMNNGNRIKVTVESERDTLVVEHYNNNNHEWERIGDLSARGEIRSFARMFQRIADFVDTE